ncbi:hypothetical protein [Zobellia roscoffensis]|uniref:hypothetical protein n=1 Tax=Zobellia roscoffensis TaxID=2779508 RepID=UPI00188BBB1A|nr:hypothetical protein [Zobellia roscoffensis]
MKRTLLLFTAVLSLVGCSKDEDNENLSNLSETEQRLIGTWNTNKDFTGNTYSYNEDGTAVYINDYGGDITIYDGFWDVTDGDVLIEFYPDADETTENWQENPTLKNKIEFLDDDYTLKETDFHDDSRVNAMYREGLKEGQKVTEQPYLIEFKTGELAEYVSVFATMHLYDSEGVKSTVYKDINRETKTLTLQVPENIYRVELEFYIEDASTVEMKFYGTNDENTIHEETINDQEYTYEYIF